MMQHDQDNKKTQPTPSAGIEVQACPSPGPVTCTPLIRPIEDGHRRRQPRTQLGESFSRPYPAFVYGCAWI
jgi:hypothetical protein